MEFLKRNITKYHLIILITVVGTILRIAALGSREVWYDEAYSGLLVNQPWEQMLKTIELDVHPPLYYLILRAWVSLFGNTEVTIRSLSMVFGIALIPLSFFIANKITKDKTGETGLLTALIFAISNFFVSYSVEARTYMLVAFGFLVALYFFDRAIHTELLEVNLNWIGFGITISILFLLHYVSLFGILSFGIYAFIYFWRKEHLKLSNVKVFIKILAPGLIFPVVAFGLWLPVFIFQLNRTQTLGWIPTARLSFLPTTIYNYLFGVDNHALGVPPSNPMPLIEAGTIGMLIFVVLVLLFAHRFFVSKKNRDVLFFLSFMSLVPICLIILASDLFEKHFYMERYMIGYGTILIVLLSYIVTKFLNRKWLLLSTIVYIGLVFLSWPKVNEPGYKSVANLIEEQSVVGSTVLVSDPIDVSVIEYYMSEERRPYVKIYDPNFKNNYESWSIIEKEDVIDSLRLLKQNDIFVSVNSELNDVKYELVEKINRFYVYKVV